MTRSARRGFTRVELLVLCGIGAILIGLFLPACRQIREPAARIKCSNCLKQLLLASHNYQSANNVLPPGCYGPGVTPEDRLSWMVLLLPYLEHDDWYREIDSDKGYEANLPALQKRFLVFQCPTCKEAAKNEVLTTYIAMAGIGRDAAKQPAGAAGNGFMGYDRRTKSADITDGLENTMALIETRSGLGPWGRGGPSTLRGFDPTDLPLFGEGRPFGGMHTGGMNAGMADGSVRFISTSIDPKKLAAAMTIAGGERVDVD